MLIIIYQLLPISWLVILYQRVSELNPNTKAHDALKKRDEDPSLAHLRFLFVEYTGDRWFWDIVSWGRGARLGWEWRVVTPLGVPD